MRVRYETFCDGRLLKVFEQVDITTGMHAVADGTEFVDGQHFWKIDEQRVADDVAQAMLAQSTAATTGPGR
jgi:hypothetical protein